MKTPFLSRCLPNRFGCAATLLIMAGLAMLPANLPAAAVRFNVKWEVPFDNFIVPNYCSGELINEQGSITVWISEVDNAAGGSRFRIHENFQATGIGSFGNEYVIHDQFFVTEGPTEDGGYEWTETFQFVQVSKGEAVNSRYLQTLHFRVYPDGTLEVEVLHVIFECHG